MTARVYAVGAGTRFDERRNTSRVFGPEPGSGMRVAQQLMRMRIEDWYRWAIAYGRQEHLHDSKRDDGSLAACPVRGCNHGRSKP